MSTKERHGHQTAIAALTGALALVTVFLAAGLVPAPHAQAAPHVERVLGVTKESRRAAVELGPAADMSAQVAASEVQFDETFGTPQARKATVIPQRTLRAPSGPILGLPGRGSAQTGWRTATVSWYGPGFYGNTMAGGGTLERNSMVVAHRSLPFGTRIEFEYGGRTCVAVVMDRGPYVSGRTFDLGPGTAQALRFGGVGRVRYRILGR